MTSKYLPAGVSPLPWTHDKPYEGHVRSGDGDRLVAGCMGYTSNLGDPTGETARLQNVANTRYIAHAANEHVALCEALEELLEIASWCEGDLEFSREDEESTTSAQALLARCEQAAR